MKILSRISILLSLLMRAGDQPVTIPIQNPSFEQVSAFRYTDNCGTGLWFATNWDVGPGSAVFQPANPNACGIALPPTGTTVITAGYGSTFAQKLNITPQELQGLSIPNYGPAWTEGTYVLTFSVANYFPKYPGYYTAEVSFGTQELCETSGWGTQKFTQVVVVCPSPQYIIGAKALPGGGPVQGLSNFVIHFSADGWTLLFDDVSLTFTPIS